MTGRMEQFESHVFELQKQYTQHMNPRKIGRFLNMLKDEGEDGKMSALSMYHYVLTVEAMYLQMMFVYYINREDMESVVEQLENFTAHNKDLTSTMSSILKLDEQIPEFKHKSCVYKELSVFGQLCLTEESKPEEMAGFMSNNVIDKPVFFHENCD